MQELSDIPSKGFVIAIDGPVASGKGTIASLLAEKLFGFHLYTGAFYRCVALYCIENGIDLLNEELVYKALDHIIVDLTEYTVFLNDQEVSERIKEKDVARGSSVIAVYPMVRKWAVGRQQEIAEREKQKGKAVIAEGRDTGTVIFPKADLKIFLTADPLIRAKRRKTQEGLVEPVEDVLKTIKERDKRDIEREADPLVKNPREYGYVVIDNSGQTEEETINTILQELQNRGLIP